MIGDLGIAPRRNPFFALPHSSISIFLKLPSEIRVAPRYKLLTLLTHLTLLTLLTWRTLSTCFTRLTLFTRLTWFTLLTYGHRDEVAEGAETSAIPSRLGRMSIFVTPSTRR